MTWTGKIYKINLILGAFGSSILADFAFKYHYPLLGLLLVVIVLIISFVIFARLISRRKKGDKRRPNTVVIAAVIYINNR
jgi:Kef-type K+ transport system membrane component KefB